jgi:hypothetical protein
LVFVSDQAFATFLTINLQQHFPSNISEYPGIFIESLCQPADKNLSYNMKETTKKKWVY